MGKAVRRAILFLVSECKICSRVKEYLQQREVAFEERDVQRDPEALAELQRKTHQNQVPVLRVGDEYVVGYNPREIDRVVDRIAS